MTVADPEAFVHAPVLLDEVVELFTSCRDGVIVDATLGGGGHAAALVDGAPDRSIIGVDRDRDPLAGHRVTPGAARSAHHAPRALRDGLRTLLRRGAPTNRRSSVSCSTSGSPRRSSTVVSAASATGSTHRWTCAWTGLPDAAPPTS